MTLDAGSGNRKCWRWAIGLLVLISLILGSVHYNINTVYIGVTLRTIESEVDTDDVAELNEHMREIGDHQREMKGQYEYDNLDIYDTNRHDVVAHNHAVKYYADTDRRLLDTQPTEDLLQKVVGTYSKSIKQLNQSTAFGNKSIHPQEYEDTDPLYNKQNRGKFHIPVGLDSVYAVPDLESLRINTTKNLASFVLLVTYARSGSTWLGAITSQADNSFYVFEPLFRLIREGYYKENSVCFNNNQCRKPRGLLEQHKFAITTLYRLFTCRFSELHPRAADIFAKNLKRPKEIFKACMDVSKSIMSCLLKMESVCLKMHHRILKTIRISMDLVYIMMDLWPNLKVIHLVRDPRGITRSRQRITRAFGMVNQLVPHSRDLCNRMHSDVEYDWFLNEAYSDRLKLVFYEALAERPMEGTKYIYKFLDMELTMHTAAWVLQSSHSKRASGYYGVLSKNSTTSAYSWRTQMSLSTITTIDIICKDVYKQLGFVCMNTLSELSSLNIPSRRLLNNANWFS